VFLDRGLVSFVSTYYKGYDFTKKVKVIYRYVPRDIKALLRLFKYATYSSASFGIRTLVGH
jgi:hypothetical protein